MPRRAWLLRSSEVVIVLALMGYVLAGLPGVPFHGDEATFIHMSHDYHYLVQQRDPVAMWEFWFDDNPYNYTLRLLNGALNPLTIGLAWDLGGLTVEDLTGQWDWTLTTPRYGVTQWEANVWQGNVPGDDLLHTARIPAALLAALSVAFVYAAARGLARLLLPALDLTAPLAGLAAASLYVTTPAVLVNGRRAMQEGGLLCAMPLVILVALGAMRTQSRPDTRWQPRAAWYGLLGVASGAAIAAKHTAALIVAAAFLALLVEPRLRLRDASGVPFDRRHVLTLIAAGLVAMLTAQLMLPVLWSGVHSLVLAGLIVLFAAAGAGLTGRRQWIINGIGGALVFAAMLIWGPAWFDVFMTPFNILGERAALMEIQADRIGSVETVGERAGILLHEAFFAAPQYFEDPPWADFTVIADQIAVYERSGLAGRGGGIGWGVLLIGLTGAGLVSLLQRGREGPALLTLAWLLVPALLLLLTDRLGWQRYYLPLHAPLAVVAGLGAGRLASVSRDWLTASPRHPAATRPPGDLPPAA